MLPSPPSLLVQGWTGINHSYAMVNQYQLLELAQNPGLALYSEQMPLFDARWNASSLNSGFGPVQQQVLDSIRKYEGQPLSAIYRIHTPNHLQLASVRVSTFLVTELGLDHNWFTPDADIGAYQREGNLIVTPSHWSRERIISYGFRPESVLVIPHGVDTSKFFPFEASQRISTREALGFGEDDVVFLNVGAPIWNKGMDLAIEAFFAVRKTCKTARLLIKDQQSLYGLSAVQMIKDMVSRGTIAADEASINSIRVLPQTLSIEQLRGLYNLSDYYLSPYRAEGFNLPVIEAIACGTPAIVTAGGSTDDFCDDYTAIRIPSTKHLNARINDTPLDAYLQPDMDALIRIMQNCCENRTPNDKFAFGRANMLELFTWKRAARLMEALM